jgi:hypothetical protein
MKRVPGFIYMYSEILKQEIALSNKTGIVYCQDEVQYSREEIRLISKDGGKISLDIHAIKKIFKESEVISNENKNGTGTENQGKSVEGSDIKNVADNPNTSDKIQKNMRSGEDGKDGCFDIY